MSIDWPAGVARIVLDTAESTNAEAMRADPPAWVLARRQTAGRGRRGRRWESPEGNFAASLVLQPGRDAAGAALYSFVAALALHDVLARLTQRPLALKWPNDVLLDGGKVAGILLESAGTGGQIDRLAIGFGVNLAIAPAATEEGALPAVALGTAVSPEGLLDRLAPAFCAREAEFRSGGFAPIRAAWLARAARLGEPIRARTGTCSLSGRFDGLDDSGALLLAGATGRQAIPAADVFF